MIKGIIQSSIKELTAESVSLETQKRLASITMQLQILSNVGGGE